MLPGTKNFVYVTEKKVKISLGNVRAKVHNAIASILDAYFDCKRNEWNVELSDEFQNKLNNMYVRTMLLWELNQTILNQGVSSKANKMRNIHKHQHLPLYTRLFGSLGKIDTSTFESFHKVSTTGIWEKTSRKNDTLFVEMTRKFITYRHNKCKTFLSNVLGEDREKYITKLKNLPPTGVIFQRLRNQPSYEFYISSQQSKLVLDDDIWVVICNQSCLRTPKQFYDMLILVNYDDLLQNQYNIPKTDFHLYEMCFIKGLTFTSGEESQMGSGTLYATPKYNNTSKYVTFKDIPRYDYIFINNGTDQPTLALSLIHI